MKPKDRRDLYNKLQKAANPIKKKGQILSTKDLAEKVLGAKDNVRR
jgi:hypothetical protein